MTIFLSVKKPTLILDEEKAKKNLSTLYSKITNQKIRFRPHFKTHQSNEIGEWFRQTGIDAITVSSVEMAQYFSENNWNDILIAFPVNILQIEEIVQLSKKIELSLLFEDVVPVKFLDLHLSRPVKGWIKIDSGANRCGLNFHQIEKILELAETMKSSKNIHLQGLLTHAGHTYLSNNPAEIIEIYERSVKELNELRNGLHAKLSDDLEISVGDTPSASLVKNFGMVDELRPGNFLFYDVQQYVANVCHLENIAVCVACPVVAIHPEKKEVVIFGGAIHFSKDTHAWKHNQPAFGLVTLPNATGWDHQVYGYVKSLSQEHGVLAFPNDIPDSIKIGSIVCVLPAHSCLTVQAMRQYMTLDGEVITTMLV
jgi:D-serine deaminase-like pyridoxal phosphate-dependent protein